MQYLSRLALKFIYDKENMTFNEESLMQRSIVFWNKKVNLGFAEKERLQEIGWLLQRNADGKLEERKETFKRHKVDYLKFHRMPEKGPYVN